jgi:hypothetical protein
VPEEQKIMASGQHGSPFDDEDAAVLNEDFLNDGKKAKAEKEYRLTSCRG